MNARENLLQTLRGGQPQWIPVCPSLTPNENPTQGVPEALQELFRASWFSSGRATLKFCEYLGAEDFLIPVHATAGFASDTCPVKSEEVEKGRFITTLSTPKGDLHQVSVAEDGYPMMTTERYVKTVDDAIKLTAYFESLRVKPADKSLQEARELYKLAGDKAVLFCRTMGTPLGMCYRVYSDITNLVYMIADAPGIMGDLFACMEEKYLRLYEWMLRENPEIDAFLGMDDTSTTLISPDMFDSFNVALTNKRADLCHSHGKIYLHHSCGLIHDLLPIYRKTRIDGVDAFTPPPVGDVGYAQGRELLGGRYSMRSGLASGLCALDKKTIAEHVAARFADARIAGNVAFCVGGAALSFAAMETVFTEAERIKR